jgi:hypothetical protein
MVTPNKLLLKFVHTCPISQLREDNHVKIFLTVAPQTGRGLDKGESQFPGIFQSITDAE